MSICQCDYLDLRRNMTMMQGGVECVHVHINVFPVHPRGPLGWFVCNLEQLRASPSFLFLLISSTVAQLPERTFFFCSIFSLICSRVVVDLCLGFTKAHYVCVSVYVRARTCVRLAYILIAAVTFTVSNAGVHVYRMIKYLPNYFEAWP